MINYFLIPSLGFFFCGGLFKINHLFPWTDHSLLNSGIFKFSNDPSQKQPLRTTKVSSETRNPSTKQYNVKQWKIIQINKNKTKQNLTIQYIIIQNNTLPYNTKHLTFLLDSFCCWIRWYKTTVATTRICLQSPKPWKSKVTTATSVVLQNATTTATTTNQQQQPASSS